MHPVKRKRDELASAAVGTGDRIDEKNVHIFRRILSQVGFAVEYLKDRRVERSFNDITGFLSIQHINNDEELQKFRLVLQKYESRVAYNPHGLKGAGSYKYKPVIPVESKEGLLRFLQQQPHSVAVKFDDIKDGWGEEARDGIDTMALEGQLLVLRDKKSLPKAVWQNDPSMCRPISDDLKHAWQTIKLPSNPDDLRDKLEAVGLKPTSAPRQAVRRTVAKDAKKRNIRKGGRTTNTHITHLLRDYSDRRK